MNMSQPNGNEKPARGLRRVIKAAHYSYKGFVFSFKNEASFREEVFAALVLIPIAMWVDVSAVERVLLVSSVLLVLVVELLNTAIEAVVDRAGLERHVLAGAAKDAGSAAVFVTLMMWALTWGSILIPRLF
jgi:diacylglycerol kinase (ATP)